MVVKEQILLVVDVENLPRVILWLLATVNAVAPLYHILGIFPWKEA
jgi:hypothetical protein